MHTSATGRMEAAARSTARCCAKDAPASTGAGTPSATGAASPSGRSPPAEPLEADDDGDCAREERWYLRVCVHARCPGARGTEKSAPPVDDADEEPAAAGGGVGGGGDKGRGIEDSAKSRPAASNTSCTSGWPSRSLRAARAAEPTRTPDHGDAGGSGGATGTDKVDREDVSDDEKEVESFRAAAVTGGWCPRSFPACRRPRAPQTGADASTAVK